MNWGEAKAFLSRNRLTIIIGLGILVSLVLIVTAPTFKECIRTNQEAYSRYHPKEGAPGLIGIAYWCGGTVIKESAEAITAVATLFIGIFTATLWLVTDGTLKLAREEFVSSHRPKLRVRHFRMELPVEGEPVELQFALSNIGDTAATVAVVEVTLILAGRGWFLKDKKLIPTNIEDSRTFMAFPIGDKIAAGDSVILKGKSTATFEPAHGAPDEDWFIRRVWLTGTITYADDRGVRRRTSFYRWCREFTRFEFMENFTKAQKRDWEYED